MLRSVNATGWSLSYLEDYGPSIASPHLCSGCHYPSSYGAGVSLLACPEILLVSHYQFPKVWFAKSKVRSGESPGYLHLVGHPLRKGWETTGRNSE